jgi:regulation of enolase protein 1 (concanavalin A-like superfamily)
MYRETLDANSKNVALVVRPDGAIHLQTRSSTGGGTGSSSVGMVSPETWIKLVRSGNNFDAYYSGDGVTWTYITTKTLSMAVEVEAGLAVTSHKDSVLCTAIFSNVNVE